METMCRLNANVLDVNRMDGAELLMPEERELCSVGSCARDDM